MTTCEAKIKNELDSIHKVCDNENDFNYVLALINKAFDELEF